jgi:general secretion pathway protein J
MTNGFTLVETLVALFVFGLIAAAGVLVLGSSADAQLRLAALSDEVQGMQRLRAALRADLAQAAERRPRGEAGESLPVFAPGDSGGRMFALVRRGWENPAGAPRASLQFVEYRHEGDTIVRRTRPMVDGAAFSEPAVLAHGVADVSVAYRSGPDWREVWDPKPGAAPIPGAVQIDVQTARFGIVRQLFLTGAAA